MGALRAITLVAATLTTGLMAGLFYSWSISVMPGMAKSSDRTFVEGLQRMNEAIQNGWFFLCFIGAVLLTALAALLHLGKDVRSVLPWIIAALVLYVAMLAITFGINVPLNNEIDAAGDVDAIADLAAVRERFEASWVRWNVVRTLVNTAAFGCLAWALVQFGRVTA